MKVPKPRKLSSGKWFIQLRLGGQSVPVTAASEKKCTATARMLKAEYKAGKLVLEPKEKEEIPPTPTLREAMTAYIDGKRNILSPSTIRGYVCIRDNRFPGVIDTPINEIGNWQEVINTEAGLHAPKTVKNEWRFVCSVLRENGIMPPSVALPQIVANEHPYLEADQIKPFIEAVKGDPCEVAALLGLHSLRRSEILALDWKNVDLPNGLIHVAGAAVYDDQLHLVQKAANKNASSRRDVPIMIPALTNALQAVPEDQRDGAVVRCGTETIYKRINRVCDKLGYPKIGVHGLRHSFASLAFSAEVGLTEREVMEIGGWSDPQTVHKIYEHLSKKNRLKAGNKMADFFKSTGENANKNANKEG